MRVYYNEIEPFAIEWLKELMFAGVIPKGEVDTRSIADVQPTDLAGYDQCHFFAGIGGWAYALGLARWPADEPVWTGSCPCQPFSHAGQRKGEADKRHLWPHFLRLIAQSEPLRCFGEQVAGAGGLGWLSGVQTDLETFGYRIGAAALPAGGFSAPHRRERLWWVADSPLAHSQHDGGGTDLQERRPQGGTPDLRPVADDSGLANTSSQGHGPLGGSVYPVAAESGGTVREREQGGSGSHRLPERDGATGGISDSDSEGRGRRIERDTPFPRSGGHANGGDPSGAVGHAASGGSPSGGHDLCPAEGAGTEKAERSVLRQLPVAGSPVGGCWDDFDILPFLDGKARRVESGTFPLAHGIPGRVGRLRGYGNAIVPACAAAFIKAYMDEVGL